MRDKYTKAADAKTNESGGSAQLELLGRMAHCLHDTCALLPNLSRSPSCRSQQHGWGADTLELQVVPFLDSSNQDMTHKKQCRQEVPCFRSVIAYSSAAFLVNLVSADAKARYRQQLSLDRTPYMIWIFALSDHAGRLAATHQHYGVHDGHLRKAHARHP